MVMKITYFPEDNIFHQRWHISLKIIYFPEDDIYPWRWHISPKMTYFPEDDIFSGRWHISMNMTYLFPWIWHISLKMTYFPKYDIFFWTRHVSLKMTYLRDRSGQSLELCIWNVIINMSFIQSVSDFKKDFRHIEDLTKKCVHFQLQYNSHVGGGTS